MIPFSIITVAVLDSGVVRVDFSNPVWETYGDNYTFRIDKSLHKSGVIPEVKIVDTTQYKVLTCEVVHLFNGDVVLVAPTKINKFMALFMGDAKPNVFPFVTEHKKLSVSSTHIAVLENDGTLYLPGDYSLNNTNGYYIPSSLSPEPLGFKVVDVWCGASSTVILSEDGKYYGKGLNTNYRMGLPEQKTYSEWEEIPITVPVEKLIHTELNTVYLTTTDELYVAGAPNGGIYGTGSTTQAVGFVKSNISDIANIYMFSALFVKKKDNSLWSCGNNTNGVCGIGITGSNVPNFTQCVYSDNTPILDVSEVNVFGKSCFISVNGVVYAAGYNVNNFMNIPDGLAGRYSSFTRTAMVNNVNSLVATSDISIIPTVYGDEYICGKNRYNLVNAPSTSELYSMYKIPYRYGYVTNEKCGLSIDPLDDVIGVSGSTSGTSVGIYSPATSYKIPQPLNIITKEQMGDINVKSMASNVYRVFLLMDNGEILTSGDRPFPGIASSTEFMAINNNIPSNIVELITPTYQNTSLLFARCDDGSVWVRGVGNYLGVSNFTNEFKRLPIQNIKKICYGGDNGIILTNSGDVYTIGVYSGTGTTVSVWTLVESSAIDVASSRYSQFILKSDGTVLATGSNGGLFGNGTTTGSNTFIKLTNVSDITRIAATNEEFFVLNRTGELYGTGITTYGVLGTTTPVTTFILTDSDVIDFTTGVGRGTYGCIIVNTSTQSYYRGVNIDRAMGNIGNSITNNAPLDFEYDQVLCSQTLIFVRNGVTYWRGATSYYRMGTGVNSPAGGSQVNHPNIVKLIIP